jgi:crotonobetainyl-CoA:carnitine CoA-transferase CaiB-like acyl-CoA transferase
MRPYNRMWLANSVNRNKLGITLDLGSAEGRDLFLALVRKADLVAENFTPRVLPNFDLAFDRLRQEKSDIILLSMPGYGLDGPYSDFPAIGGTIEPMSGNAALLGEPGGLPQTSGLMYPDAVAGLHGAAAALAALQRRASTGEGSHVEVAQQESMLSMTARFYAHGGWSAPAGNLDPAGSDERIERSEAGWVARSAGAASPVRSIAEVIECEQLRARGFFVEVDQVDVGLQTMPGVVPRLSRSPGAVRWGAPGHGQDSRRVLREVLGLDDEAIDRLEAAGITGEGPPAGWDG